MIIQKMHFKRVIIIVLICFFALTNHNIYAEDALDEPCISNIKILFIGNSSTYYNDMPKMIQGLANANNLNVDVSMITAGNYKLTQFANSDNPFYQKIVDALETERWDYVVLQEHRESIIETPLKSRAAIETLKCMIDENGAKTILYETQADCVGKIFKIDDVPLYLTHMQIQYYLNRNYYMIGNELDIPICTAGIHYTRCMKLYPEINLYAGDLLHPSVEGSYLAACSLYQTIFGVTARGNDFLPESEFDTQNLLLEMSKEDAKKLQDISDASLSFDNNNITLIKGASGKVTAKFNCSLENPIVSENTCKIEYYSLNDQMVSVDTDTGVITAMKTGNTMIMAKTDSGLMAMCSVSVTQPSFSLLISDDSIIRLYRKESYQLSATMNPIDTTDKIMWSSSKPSIATVDDNGFIVAKKIGTTTITAITDSGITLTRKVYVRLKAPTNVKVRKLNTKASEKNKANIKVSWSKNTNAMEYEIYRRTLGKTYTKIATTKKLYYKDKNRVKGKTYYYKIKAVYSNTKCNSLKTKAVKIVLAK